jgi:hypothetical protein
MEALIDETTNEQVSREDLLDFVQKFKEYKESAAAVVGTPTGHGARGTPSARGTKRSGGSYGTDAQLAAEPWRRKATVDEYKSHFNKFPVDGCCFHLVHHNFPDWQAQMAKLKKKRCPCIAGYDIRNGQKRGEDFSVQATPAEMRRVWNLLSKMEAARVKEDAMDGSDWKLNGRKYMDMKYKLKSDTIKHWQSIKHALKSSAAVQLAPAVEKVEEEEEWMRAEDARIEGDATEQGRAHSSVSCMDKKCTQCVLPRMVWNDGEGFKLEADGVEKRENRQVRQCGVGSDVTPVPPVLPPPVRLPPPSELPTPLPAMDECEYYQHPRDAEEDADGLRRVLRHSKLDYRSAREMELLAAGHTNRAVIGAMITEECNQPSRVEDWRTEAEGFIQRMRVQTNLRRAEIAMEGEEAWAAWVRADRAANPMSDEARVRLLIRLGRQQKRNDG